MILLDKNRINRTLKRISYQILEEVRESPVHLVGLNQRGYLIAEKIKVNLENYSEKSFPLSRINANDSSSFQFESAVDNDDILILIDDVIFSGTTMYKAIDKIGELSRFKKVFVVVLIDRGHRKVPIQAEVIGKYVPTKLNEQIELIIKGNTPEKVILTKQ